MRQISMKLLCLLLVLLLAAAAMTGCAQNNASTEAPQTEAQTEASKTAAPQTEAPQTEAPQTEAQTEAPQTEPAAPAERIELGEGDKLFYFDVTFSNGETVSYAISTDAETVGEALVALDLIAGEDSAYGLYVKTIGEETLDYTTDGMYWAFYENGEYAMSGVDATAVTEGAAYAFVATKG